MSLPCSLGSIFEAYPSISNNLRRTLVCDSFRISQWIGNTLISATPSVSFRNPEHHVIPALRCINKRILFSTKSKDNRFICSSDNVGMHSNTLGAENEISLDKILNTATALYPLYIAIGGLVALARPETFHWFVSQGPNSYSFTLGFIMMSMGLTLNVKDLVDVIVERPWMIAFGCSAQYSLMPLLGYASAHVFHLPADVAAGVILLACCPGGTASNVVTLIARGDVPLSVMMTVAATLTAVAATPLLTGWLAGAFVPVDAMGLAVSTLQVVVLPILIGAWLKSSFSESVQHIARFCPLMAVLMSSLLASSVFSSNVPLFVNLGLPACSATVLVQTVGAVLSVHAGGFVLGYVATKLFGFGEPQRRAVSIEVGMQNSSLGVVLASKHFASPAAALPAAISAILMNFMGSLLAAWWRHSDNLRVGDDVKSSIEQAHDISE